MKKIIIRLLNKRTISAALGLGLCITLAVSAIAFDRTAGEVKDSLLRLHIIANSDSETDQQLKIKVRDRLLKEGKLFLGDSENLDRAKQAAEQSLDELAWAAEDELRKNGCDLNVSASLTKAEFDTRTYGSVTLPAGEYDALQVIIGEGKGKNWWCVMFPPMCVSAGCQVQSDGDSLKDVLSEDGAELVSGGEKYKVKFKAAEIYETVRSTLVRLFG